MAKHDTVVSLKNLLFNFSNKKFLFTKSWKTISKSHLPCIPISSKTPQFLCVLAADGYWVAWLSQPFRKHAVYNFVKNNYMQENFRVLQQILFWKFKTQNLLCWIFRKTMVQLPSSVSSSLLAYALSWSQSDGRAHHLSCPPLPLSWNCHVHGMQPNPILPWPLKIYYLRDNETTNRLEYMSIAFFITTSYP